MLADATHDLGREQGLSCRCNASTALPGSSNAAPGSNRCCPPGCAIKRIRSVSSKGDSLPEDTPFRAALRTALFDRNGGSAEFFNSLLIREKLRSTQTSGLVLRRPWMRSPAFHWPRFLSKSTRSKRFRTLRLTTIPLEPWRLLCCDMVNKSGWNGLKRPRRRVGPCP